MKIFRTLLLVGIPMLTLTLGMTGCDKDDDTETTDPVTDIDGNIYATVRIGNKIWMKENLNVTHYNDGEPIALVTTGEAWKELDTPAFCWYDNQESNGETYGALYNWNAVNTGKLCPAGWHVPTRQEWDEMIDLYGGPTKSGAALKDKGTQFWSAPNTGATNESGFTALPAGGRDRQTGMFQNKGLTAYFWTSSDDYVYTAWPKLIFHNSVDMTSSFADRKTGMSVRCVKD